jgi:hypothetical protein
MTNTNSTIDRNKKPIGSIEIPADFKCYYLTKKDRQMRFNNATDPIYVLFDKIEDRPLKQIAKDFVKELKDDTIKFISKALR